MVWAAFAYAQARGTCKPLATVALVAVVAEPAVVAEVAVEAFPVSGPTNAVAVTVPATSTAVAGFVLPMPSRACVTSQKRCPLSCQYTPAGPTKGIEPRVMMPPPVPPYCGWTGRGIDRKSTPLSVAV